MNRTATKRPAAPKGPQVIGWREWVSLPELGLPAFKAKIDTGARTSALHAVEAQTFTRDGEDWASFVVPLLGHQRREARIVDHRAIKNTSGIPETRLVVKTTLILGTRKWRIETSLANRENMGFELILGRTAIRRHRLVVDSGRSFLAGPPVGRPEAARSVPRAIVSAPAASIVPDLGEEE